MPTRIRRFLLALGACTLVLAPLSQGGSFPGRNGPLIAVSGTSIQSVPADGSSASALATGSDAAISPDGSKLAYVTAGGAIDVTCLAGGCSTQVAAAGADPAWSPDGASLAWVDASHHLQVTAIAADGTPGATTPVAPSEAHVASPAWSPDGSAVAFVSTRGTADEIWTVTVSSGVERQVTAGPSDASPTWSPDGARIAFASAATGTSEIYSVSASGGALTQLTNDATADVDPVWSPDGTLVAFLQGHALKTVAASGGSATEQAVGSASWDLLADWQPAVATADPASPPTVSTTANPIPGDTVTAGHGAWNGLVTGYLYQFERCASDGTGCTPFGSPSASSSYTLTSSDVGSRLEVLVTATDAAGSSAAAESTSATPVVLGSGPTNLSLPVASWSSGAAAPAVGTFVFGTTGTWTGNGNTYAFQWKRCASATSSCANIAGATSSGYLVTSADYGSYLRVMVRATNSSGSSTVSSAATPQVTADKPAFHASPPVSGVNQVGQTLFASAGTWTGTSPITFGYQWRRCDPQGTLPSCVPVAGATSTSYTLTAADDGVTLRVYVTATNIAGSTVAVSNHTFPTLPAPTSTPASPLRPQAETQPTVEGAPFVGQTLTATRGTWTGATPIRFRYEWSRCDATGAACRRIRHAAKATYAVGAADAGSTLKVIVVARNPAGATAAISAATDTVSMAKPPVRGRHILGSQRADYLPGGGGNDVIEGRGGNDTLLGGAGNDTLDGGSGNDVIDGGSGSDRIFGGPGSDTIRAVDDARDVIDCGPGRDRVYADSVDVVVGCESVIRPAS